MASAILLKNDNCAHIAKSMTTRNHHNRNLSNQQHHLQRQQKRLVSSSFQQHHSSTTRPPMMSGHNNKMSKLLLLGDSLTQTSFEGWGGMLANLYQRRADILNRGMSGYNTRWYLRYAQDNGVWEESGNIVLVTIFFGANDAALIDQDPSKHVPPVEYGENLRTLITRTRESYPTAKILLIAPPPVHQGQRLEFQKMRYKEMATGIPERTSEHTLIYAQKCVEIAKEMKVPSLDMFDAMMKDGDGDFGQFLWDGLHFSKLGHEFVFEQLTLAIKTHYPGIAVEPDPATGQPNNSGSQCQDIPNNAPHHNEINYKEWEKAFEKK
jgi:lysophospholipase L1-like esterase